MLLLQISGWKRALVWLLVQPTLLVTGSHHYTDSFPTYDEYDFAVLDPEHIYGSPYGGFSRATRSRLAALPLFLPDLSDKEPSDDPLHMEVRDAEGRLFVCRVYHEDELDPDTLEESMFNCPKLRKLESTTSTQDMPSAPNQSEVEKSELSNTMVTKTDESIDSNKGGVDGYKGNKLLQIQARLGELDGICGQMHKGWWSYEVCFGGGKKYPVLSVLFTVASIHAVDLQLFIYVFLTAVKELLNSILMLML